MSKVAILSYHKLGAAPGGWETWYYNSAESFEGHLVLLRVRGYEFIDLARFYRGLDGEGLPERAALVTFDDGYLNNLTVGLPIMRRLGVPGVIFVPTRYIGGWNSWDAGNEPDDRICGWDELRELERGGVAVESHSVSHPAFSQLSEGEQEGELQRSKEVLEAGLGRAVEFFAYPYGDAGRDAAYSEAVLRRVGYRGACLYGGGVVGVPGGDRFRLERLAIGADSDLAALLGEENCNEK